MAKRIGNQQPTQSLIRPSVRSEYELAVELYERSGRNAYEWQKLLLKDIMGKSEDDLWTHTKFGYSVPRRNGKNEIAAIVEMWALEEGLKVLHTAHRTTTSHMAWERLCGLLDKSQTEYTSLKATGREQIETPGGGRVDFRTRSSSGGLGEGFDILIIDEAQEYTNDEESALKYVVSDSDDPMTLMCGTPPTPISSGTVFTGLRKQALLGESENTGWAEWSVEDESDVNDRDLWYLTNPSLGYKLSERAVADEIGTDAIDFNIQRLGLWLKYNQKSAISETEWAELKVNKLPELAGKLFVGIKYGNDGTNTAMSIAAKTTDGKVFVETIDCQSVRNGNSWILSFLKAADVQGVAIDGASGQGLLAEEMKKARLKPPILPTVKEVVLANSTFEQAVYQKTLCHKGQPSLEQVVTNSDKRPIGSSGGFGYRSQVEDYDVALMDSVLLAHWLCADAKPAVKQKIRY